MDQIVGFIDHIVFSSDDTGFTVLKLKIPALNELVTTVGTLTGINPGETLSCRGIWKHHSKHGRQFEVESYSISAPSDITGIQKYLESGMVKGVGPIYAQRIVKKFGTQTLEIIDKNPDRLGEVTGLGGKRIDKIKQCWGEQKGIRNVMIFLQAHRVRPSFAQKVFRKYGESSIEKVKENPYALAKEIYGIGFKSADELAQNLGIPMTSSLRIKAGIEHALWELSSEGHVCYPQKELTPYVHKLLSVDEELIDPIVSEITKDGLIVTEKIEDKNYIWVRALYNAESGVARELQRVLSAECFIRQIQVAKAIEWGEDSQSIKFADEQKEAISKCLEKKIHIVTGGPGTGKSTITRAILSITSKVTSKIMLAAPTGRAAKRMTEITGRKAFTIHSLLEFDFTKGGFKKNKDNPIEADMIIIDEASMIDTLLMFHLMKAIPSKTRLIFIGDIDQLPSVGPGNILKDMISSSVLSVTCLKQIFRQGKGSKIVANAHKINAGYFPELENEKGSDFIFLHEDSAEDILQKISALVDCHIPEKFPFHPINDIQVLSPMKKGVIGIDNLNFILQKKLNPQTHAIERMGRCFHLYDKVMQLRNNYDKKVYNGDVGRIVQIDTEEQELLVNFDGKEVPYEFGEIDEITLAYAVSIHKYQGSECPCVIIPVHTSHFKLLYRNLLYTGITRGKKLVVVIGTKKALAIAVKTDNVKTRHTGLQHFLNSPPPLIPALSSLF